MWEFVKWIEFPLKFKKKIEDFIKVAIYLKKFFTSPKQLDNHEARLKALEGNNLENKIDADRVTITELEVRLKALEDNKLENEVDADRVTITEINEAIAQIATLIESVRSNNQHPTLHPDPDPEMLQTYQCIKVLYFKLIDQKNTDPPPNKPEDTEAFRDLSYINKWHEYLLKLKGQYKK